MSQWRSTDKPPVKAVHRRGIELDILARLASGELEGIGLATGANTEGRCTIIPPTFFASDSCEIDWTNSTLQSLGRGFADVRISRSDNANGNIVAPTESPAPIGKRGGGRPSQYARAKVIIAELLRNPAFEGMRAGKLKEVFNTAYLQRYSTPEIPIAPVSVRALQDYLKQYERELAETRKN